MLNRRAWLAGAIGLGASMLLPVEAFAATWVTLGSRTVDLFRDRDSIAIGAGAGLFNRIRLRVSGNTVFIRSLRVTFVNGNTRDIQLRFMFRPGSTSRDIDLPGALRRIRRIDLVYTKLPGGGRATVTVQGRRV